MTDKENNVQQIKESSNSTAYNSCPNLDISTKKFDKLFGKDGGCLTKDFKCANNDCNALFREVQNANSSEEAEISLNKLLDTQNGGLTDNQKNEQIKALLCQLGNCKKPEKKKECQFTEEKRNKHWRENPILVTISLILSLIIFGLILWSYTNIAYINEMFKDSILIGANIVVILVFTIIMGLSIYNSDALGKRDCNLFLKFFFGYVFFGILGHNLFTSFSSSGNTNSNANTIYTTLNYFLAFTIIIVIILANFYLMIYTPEGLVVALVAQKIFLTTIYKFLTGKDKSLHSNKNTYEWLNSWQFLAMPILNFYLQKKGYPMCDNNKNKVLNNQHTLNLGISNNKLSGKKNQKKICNKPIKQNESNSGIL